MESPTWEQNRVLAHMMSGRAVREEWTQATFSSVKYDPWFDQMDEPYRITANFYHSLAAIFSSLGSQPEELRLSVEPFHPLPTAARDAFVAKQLQFAGIDAPSTSFGLAPLSRALVESYCPVSLFETLQVPKEHPDLYLFDPLSGFVLWRDGDRNRNAWFGNIRDLVESREMAEPIRDLLIQTPADHFSPGKAIFLRAIGPLLHHRYPVTYDTGDIPTIEVSSQRDLEALVEDLKNACIRSSLPVAPVFRGQSSEHYLPDRSELVRAGVCLYSDIRDHSIIPSLYRKYDEYQGDNQRFRVFLQRLLDWGMFSDLVFGDPAAYFTLDGKPYRPKEVPAEANATTSFYMAGQNGPSRVFADLGPYTVWRITDVAGNLLDEYAKQFRPGYDTVRRNLILQHYGAPTSFIDVTHDIHVAEWFALHSLNINADGLTESTRTTRSIDEASIFVFFSLDGLTPIAETSALVSPSEALRPHRQACAVLGGAGNLYRNAAARFVGLKIKFGSSFVPSNVPTADWLFPGPDEDNALKRLLSFNEGLSAEKTLFPIYWFPNASPAEALNAGPPLNSFTDSNTSRTETQSNATIDVDLLAEFFSRIGFPFFALDLGDLTTVLSHPRIHEGTNYRLEILGVLPERRAAVAAALGRIMQQITVPLYFTRHFANAYIVKHRLGLSERLLTLTEDPNPQYQMTVLPERLSWDEISPWPAAYSAFMGHLGQIVRVYALLTTEQCEKLPGVSILDQSSRALPTRFHYAAGSLGAWGGGAINLQFLALVAATPGLSDLETNKATAMSQGYDDLIALSLTESGFIALPSQVVGAIFQAQGGDVIFGGTPVDEWNAANLPNADALGSSERRDGYVIDKYYRSTFKALEPGRQALYGAKDVLRDHYESFYKSASISSLVRCKHFCAPVIEVNDFAELSEIARAIPVHSSEGVFFRGQSSLYALPRHERIKAMLFGDSTSLEPSLSTSAARRNFDYDQLHFALRYFIQDQLVFGPNVSEPFEERQERWRERSRSPLCEIDYAIMAIAQHYGLPSHGLDVTTSIDVAVWFATNLWKNTGGSATYRKKGRDEWGENPSRWPVVFACQQITHSLGMSLQKCQDLSQFGLVAKRPERQQASFFHGGHSDHQNRLAETVVCAFRLKPGEWQTQASYESLFPPPEDDLAYELMLRFADIPEYESLGAKEVARYSY